MILTQVKKLITTGTTATPEVTSFVSESCAVTQIVISPALAGTAWSLVISDNAAEGGPSNNYTLVVWSPVTVPTDGKPIVINFDDPVYMTNGVQAITSGTAPGYLSVWVSYWKQ